MLPVPPSRKFIEITSICSYINLSRSSFKKSSSSSFKNVFKNSCESPSDSIFRYLFRNWESTQKFFLKLFENYSQKLCMQILQEFRQKFFQEFFKELQEFRCKYFQQFRRKFFLEFLQQFHDNLFRSSSRTLLEVGQCDAFLQKFQSKFLQNSLEESEEHPGMPQFYVALFAEVFPVTPTRFHVRISPIDPPINCKTMSSFFFRNSSENFTRSFSRRFFEISLKIFQ